MLCRYCHKPVDVDKFIFLTGKKGNCCPRYHKECHEKQKEKIWAEGFYGTMVLRAWLL